MTTANNTFSLHTRLMGVLDHSILRARNLGFALRAPYDWALINAAAVFVQLDRKPTNALDKNTDIAVVTANDLIKNQEVADQLRIKMATYRHFNRMCGAHEVHMGAINSCLKPNEDEVSLEDMKQQARDQIKIERRSGKLKSVDVKRRFIELYQLKFETAKNKKRRLAALMNEVFHLCNRSDEVLHFGNELLDPNTVYTDAELCDYDNFEFAVDTLLEKMCQPVIRAKEEVQRFIDKSNRVSVATEGAELLRELDAIGKELGINWEKIDAQNAAIDAELAAADAEVKLEDADIDCLDVDLGELDDAETTPKAHRTTIKSPERLAREAEETAARQASINAEKAAVAKAAKAKATRERNKAKVKSLGDIKQLTH